MSNLPKKSLIESSYLRIREDIIQGKLTSGEKLRIEELSLQYETGASPLREALNRLAGEGFVTAENQRGFRVSPVSEGDLGDLTRVRILLECEALRESIRKGDDEWESNIVAAYHRLTKFDKKRIDNFPEWESCNQAFHESLIAACNSAWLLRLRRVLYDQHKRYRALAVSANRISRNVHVEHKALKDAALDRDTRAACQAMKLHIEVTANRLKRGLFRKLSGQGSS